MQMNSPARFMNTSHRKWKNSKWNLVFGVEFEIARDRFSITWFREYAKKGWQSYSSQSSSSNNWFLWWVIVTFYLRFYWLFFMFDAFYSEYMHTSLYTYKPTFTFGEGALPSTLNSLHVAKTGSHTLPPNKSSCQKWLRQKRLSWDAYTVYNSI
jgi:hypothetical protein